MWKGELYGTLVLLKQASPYISPTITILRLYDILAYHSQGEFENLNFGLNNFYHMINWSVKAHTKTGLADLACLNREVEAISHLKPDDRVIIFTRLLSVYTDTSGWTQPFLQEPVISIHDGPLELGMMAKRNRQTLGVHISTLISKVQILKTKGHCGTKGATTSRSLQAFHDGKAIQV